MAASLYGCKCRNACCWCISLPVLAVDSVTVGAFSLPQVGLALFELFAQGVTWSYESQLF